MRTSAKELVGDHLIAETAPFSFMLKEGGEEIRSSPYVYVASLWEKVRSMLDQSERYMYLTQQPSQCHIPFPTHCVSNDCLHWHGGRIPSDEIWVKVGGDKGGNTFKMCFQIVNTKTPNSPSNTCVFSIFEAPDSVTNLKVIGDRFGEEICNLEHQTWK